MESRFDPDGIPVGSPLDPRWIPVGSPLDPHWIPIGSPCDLCAELPATHSSRNLARGGNVTSEGVDSAKCCRSFSREKWCVRIRVSIDAGRWRTLPNRGVVERWTADVQRSAVSVGCAAGRLTGTRGGWKADVDHSHCEVENDIDDSRRSLPSKAQVQRSAVSVGSAAGRLPGTQGTLKARVEHFIVISRRTSTIHVVHSRRRLMSNVPQSPSAAPRGD